MHACMRKIYRASQIKYINDGREKLLSRIIWQKFFQATTNTGINCYGIQDPNIQNFSFQKHQFGAECERYAEKFRTL